ncbi:MAG: histidine kinase [Ignavibacteriae bacterium]|nr:histidine kinase [Ignavibacteriota bacterium]
MRPKLFSIILHIVPWLALLLIPYAIRSSENPAAVPTHFFTIANILNIGLFYFNAFYFFPKYCNSRRWFIYVLGVITLLAALFHGKLLLLSALFPEVLVDEQIRGMNGWSALFIFLLSVVYRLAFDAIKRQQELKERDAERLTSELQLLRARVSPHFFFNVLNSLVSMARSKSDRLESSLLRLSDLMRYVLYEADGHSVSVEKEVEHLKSYIELQKMRFEDVRITVDIRSNGTGYVIEPLLLIPFIENAFKHGTGSTKEPFIDIKLTMNGPRLLLDVANRIGKPGSERNSGIGLENVKRRLRLAYPDRHELSIKEEGDVFLVNLALELQR